MNYLWLKALHIAFMVTWFAGLFYLPRLFVYHAEAQSTNTLAETAHNRFLTMQRKLFIIMSIGMLITVLLGLWLLMQNPALLKMPWLHIKLTLVAVLIIYHFYCHKLHLDFKKGVNRKSGKWLRIFNEVPAVFLFAIIILAVVKPF